jgi:hypothetical protein
MEGKLGEKTISQWIVPSWQQCIAFWQVREEDNLRMFVFFLAAMHCILAS